MEFVDDGILLSARAHGENHAVVDVFTAGHGRWMGLVYGGQGTRMRPLLQAGNRVRAAWKGRISESLGHFSLELEVPVAAAFLHDRLALTAISAATSVAGASLHEREPQPGAYEALCVVFDNLDAPELWPALLSRWELGLLAAVGFGLTLDRCAATDVRDDLIYVSPKSARAVSAAAGEPYRDRLLPLPAFLRGGSRLDEASRQDAIDGLTLTGYFLETRVLQPADKPLPVARARLVELLKAEALNGEIESG